MKYAVIIDAGSSGSRSFIYSWPDPKSYLEGVPPDSVLRDALLPIETMHNWVRKIQPGISTFAGQTRKIWKDHLEKLLLNAKDIIPKEQIPETPVYFLATAGMRLLPEKDRVEILNEVCKTLQKKTDFLVPECQSHVAMIDGQTEGLYGWLGLNYLIHWSLSDKWDDFDNTYGFLDMGGASAQLAYATKNVDSNDPHMHALRIRTASGAAVEWDVYVTTWLGHGANQAYMRLRQKLTEELNQEEVSGYVNEGAAVPVLDPCLPLGALDFTKINNLEYIFSGSGDFKKCEQLSFDLLADSSCHEGTPCLFGQNESHFQPGDMKFVGVSEFWYSFQDLFKINGKFEYSSLEPKIREFCSSEWTSLLEKLENHEFMKSKTVPFTESEVKQACFKSSWVLSVLRRGLNFPLQNENLGEHSFKDKFQSASDIYGTEISWTLGRAVLYASSQIPPEGPSIDAASTDAGTVGGDGKIVGYHVGDGTFYDGGELMSQEEVRKYISAQTKHNAGFYFILAFLLVVLIRYRFKLIKLVKRAYHKVFPSIEQRFHTQMFNMGYGETFPHAGFPLSTLNNGISSSVPSSQPPSRSPSRADTRNEPDF